MPEVDVLIVGAGLSGIGAAVHIGRELPGTSVAILEGRPDIGGTWDLFRYPGVRSDSDMHTLGYDFKPWTAEKAIADGPSIMAYLRETIEEHDLGPLIHLGRRVEGASWRSAESRWRLSVEGPEGSEAWTGRFLLMCSGYYSYEHGYTPEIPGLSDFGGQVVHPQQWPEDLDWSAKRVVVIGSGATAVTIVPKLAESAAKVTMLQRSPTYMAARSDVDGIANGLRRVLPDALAYRITRFKNTLFQQLLYRQSRSKPEKLKEELLKRVAEELPEGYDVATHFTPSYGPWDQRLCLVTNGDLFEAIRAGKVEVVTDLIDHVDAEGIVLASGQRLDADLIITATGLELLRLGGVAFDLDGEPIDFSSCFTYKGFMYSGVPNLASVFGYVNASWTLRSDLIDRFVCRLLAHMDEIGASSVTPTLRPEDASMAERPWIDEFDPSYIKRSLHLFPHQGDREPWVNPHDYRHDRKIFLRDSLDDGVLLYARP